MEKTKNVVNENTVMSGKTETGKTEMRNPVLEKERLKSDLGNRKVKNLKATIRGLMKRQGLYRKEFSYLVEILASDILAYRLIREEMISEGFHVTLKEYNTMGSEHIVINPCFALLSKMSDRVRSDLNALGMSLKLKSEKRGEDDSEKEPDPIASLLGGE